MGGVAQSDIDGLSETNCTDVELDSSELNSSEDETDSVVIGVSADTATNEMRTKAPPSGSTDVPQARSPTSQLDRAKHALGFWGRRKADDRCRTPANWV